jgi:hypothetical protein
MTTIPSGKDAIDFAGSATTIVDSSGNVWTISRSGQVVVNGVVDPTTKNVVEPPFGTSVDPIPVVASPDNTVVSGDTVGAAGTITDGSGNTWSIVEGQVTLNGVTDRTTAHAPFVPPIASPVGGRGSPNAHLPYHIGLGSSDAFRR